MTSSISVRPTTQVLRALGSLFKQSWTRLSFPPVSAPVILFFKIFKIFFIFFNLLNYFLFFKINNGFNNLFLSGSAGGLHMYDLQYQFTSDYRSLVLKGLDFLKPSTGWFSEGRAVVCFLRSSTIPRVADLLN